MSIYTEFDIIVVDDGSTDDTSTRVKEKYRDNPRIRLIEKENS
jgi:peptidoglycan-N-acetylglucosamine deacetylase